MTLLTDPVDGASTGDLWVSVSELARLKGISKQAISKRLDGFGDLVSTKAGARGSKLVNRAEYDKATGDIGDTLRTAIAKPLDDDAVEPTSSAILTAERAKRETYQAEMARLDLEERQGKLLPIADVERAMVRCAEALLRPIEGLHGRASDFVDALEAGGEAGVRALLKQVSFDLQTLLASEMRLLASSDDDDADETSSTRPS